jgi:hypothetical protein
MTACDPYALEDVWLAAVHALPDPRPLAALLRSDTPMPMGARNMLAEMLHPGDPPLTDHRLTVRRNAEFDRMIRQLGAAATYRKAIAAGMLKGKAEQAAAQEAGVTARQARRWAQEGVPERLQERLYGLDILALPNVQHGTDNREYVESDLANHLMVGAMSLPR